jgi:Na+/melibiose symporter-like transporter
VLVSSNQRNGDDSILMFFCQLSSKTVITDKSQKKSHLPQKKTQHIMACLIYLFMFNMVKVKKSIMVWFGRDHGQPDHLYLE